MTVAFVAARTAYFIERRAFGPQGFDVRVEDKDRRPHGAVLEGLGVFPLGGMPAPAAVLREGRAGCRQEAHQVPRT